MNLTQHSINHEALSTLCHVRHHVNVSSIHSKFINPSIPHHLVVSELGPSLASQPITLFESHTSKSPSSSSVNGGPSMWYKDVSRIVFTSRGFDHFLYSMNTRWVQMIGQRATICRAKSEFRFLEYFGNLLQPWLVLCPWQQTSECRTFPNRSCSNFKPLIYRSIKMHFHHGRAKYPQRFLGSTTTNLFPSWESCVCIYVYVCVWEREGAFVIYGNTAPSISSQSFNIHHLKSKFFTFSEDFSMCNSTANVVSLWD